MARVLRYAANILRGEARMKNNRIFCVLVLMPMLLVIGACSSSGSSDDSVASTLILCYVFAVIFFYFPGRVMIAYQFRIRTSRKS